MAVLGCNGLKCGIKIILSFSLYHSFNTDTIFLSVQILCLAARFDAFLDFLSSSGGGDAMGEAALLLHK
jgi:hypothetical protein